jgi:hypothetical protein
MEDVLKEVASHPLFGKKPLGVKLAPYFDTPYFGQTYGTPHEITVSLMHHELLIN